MQSWLRHRLAWHLELLGMIDTTLSRKLRWACVPLELKQLIDTLLHRMEVLSISRVRTLKGHSCITDQ